MGSTTNLSAGASVTDYIALPFRTAQPLDDEGAGRNLWAKPSSNFATVGESATNCPGTALAPTSLPGMLCVYDLQAAGLQADQGIMFAGASDVSDPADSHGFLLRVFANGAATPRINVVWVYTAP